MATLAAGRDGSIRYVMDDENRDNFPALLNSTRVADYYEFLHETNLSKDNIQSILALLGKQISVQPQAAVRLNMLLLEYALSN